MQRFLGHGFHSDVELPEDNQQIGLDFTWFHQPNQQEMGVCTKKNRAAAQELDEATRTVNYTNVGWRLKGMSCYCRWAREILHQQEDGRSPKNHGMFTIYQLLIRISQPSTVSLFRDQPTVQTRRVYGLSRACYTHDFCWWKSAGFRRHWSMLPWSKTWLELIAGKIFLKLWWQEHRRSSTVAMAFYKWYFLPGKTKNTCLCIGK